MNADLVVYGRISGIGKKLKVSPWFSILNTEISKELPKSKIFVGIYAVNCDELELPGIIIQNLKTLGAMVDALYLQENREYEEARKRIEGMKEIITKADNKADTLHSKHHFLGNLYFDQNVVLKPGHPEHVRFREQAEKEYTKSIEIDPYYHNSYFRLGYLFATSKKQPKRAIEYFAKAVELQPNEFQYIWNLAQAYIQDDNLIQAGEIIVNFLIDNPQIENEKKENLAALLKLIETKSILPMNQ